MFNHVESSNSHYLNNYVSQLIGSTQRREIKHISNEITVYTYVKR